MSEWWRSTFQTTVDAYYQGDVVAGLQACELLAAIEELPEKTERRLRQNLVFYTPLLTELAPSTSARRLEIPVPDGWSSYNPSIAVNGEGFRLILRSGNYRVDPPLRYTVHDNDGIVRTSNYLLDLDPDLAIVSAQPIDDGAFRPDPPLFRVAGFEDCRLFAHRDAWWVSATVRDRDPSGVSRIALLRLDNATVVGEHLLSDGRGRSEKNWMPVAGDDALRFIYSCAPTTILRYDDEAGAVVPDVERSAPPVARHFRGGSQAVPVDDGYLCVVHEVVWQNDGGRTYLHRWVWLDGDWQLARVSPPFTLRERGVEFVAGLARQGDSLVLSHGAWDREAWLVTVPLAEVMSLLAPPLSAAEAEAVIRATSPTVIATISEHEAVPVAAAVDNTDRYSPTPGPQSTANAEAPSTEWWRPTFQTTVDAFYRGDLPAGRAACERLLSVPGIPPRIDTLVRRNAVYYAPPLAELAPSFTTKPVEFRVPDNWTRFNPSIAADPAGNLRMIVRSSNYAFTPQMRYTIHDPDRVIRTSNYLLDLAPDLDIENCVAIDDREFRADSPPSPITGYEDCRLFAHRGAWWAAATTWDYTETKKCQMTLLRLEDANVVDMQVLSDGVSRQEKNWMPVPPSGDDDLRFVYSCFPTVVFRVDGAGDSVAADVVQAGPLVARRFSGGTQAIPFEGGRLCLVHEAATFKDSRRVYTHRWVWFDADWRLAKVSQPFVFGERRVEFAAGLALRGDDLVVSYGVWDREAWLATVALEEVVPLLAPPLDPDETAAQMCTAATVEPAASSTATVAADPVPAVPSNPTIVSTTLTGNNREIIADALRSVVDWVDWVLVVDTGVSDDTLQIAREVAGDKLIVREFPWQNDFAAARNFALQAAADTGATWAVTLDTDERLDPGDLDVRAALAEATANSLHVRKDNGIYGKERFFRLPARGQYVGPTHEAYIRDGRAETLAGIVFSELGKSGEQYRQKAERDVAILTRHTAEHPDDPRWYYYLGDSYAGLKRYEEAIAAFRVCASLDGWDEEGAWALYRSAQCWLRLNRPKDAIADCAAGMTRHPGLAELPWLASFASWKAGNAAHAAYWARQSIALGLFAGAGGSVPRNGFCHPPALWEGPYDVLRFALRKLGNDEGADEAQRLYERAKAARSAAVRVA